MPGPGFASDGVREEVCDEEWFYAGEVYNRPHHHYHAAYRFPVYVNGGVVYRPYYYCHDRLFEYGYSRPRLAFGVEFSSY